MTTTRRTVARGLLLASTGRVLLVQMDLPWLGPVWMVPGGGVEQGESRVQAVARQVAEETGLTLGTEDVGPPVWRRQVVVDHDGTTDMDELYLLIQTEEFEPEPTLATEGERAWTLGWRWWWPAEMVRSDERFEPPELGRLLMKRAVRGFGPCQLLPARRYPYPGDDG